MQRFKFSDRSHSLMWVRFVFVAAALVARVSSCSSNLECSLNGVCTNGACKCDTAWRGESCSTLNLLRPEKMSGLRTVEADGRNTSSWGGSVIFSEHDNKWHMYAAEMVKHCGIDSWMENSRIIHAVSDSPGGLYKRHDVVVPPFAHEPAIMRSEKGEYVLFFTERATATMNTSRGLCQV